MARVFNSYSAIESSREKAEAAGIVIAEALGLKKNKDGLYDTPNGIKSDIGLARMIVAEIF
jgi:GTP cyclohydrolase I